MPNQSWPETLRTICSRNALRNYTCAPVSDEHIEQLVAGMLAAPSASNKQAWSFVVVRDPQQVKLVRAFSPGVIGTPAVIVVGCVDKQRTVKSTGVVSEDIYQVSRLCVAMAIENLLLTAHALGLGGCPASSFHEPVLRQLLELPPTIEPVLLASIGYPAEKPAASTRRDRSEVISYDVWGRHTGVGSGE